ncbi:hypothetical protein [Candidatus Methylopumilus planktonicus]|nr:hypothetical protein [Candidatus Methylopumilus planktonicus]
MNKYKTDPRSLSFFMPKTGNNEVKTGKYATKSRFMTIKPYK